MSNFLCMMLRDDVKSYAPRISQGVRKARSETELSEPKILLIL